eukprot:5228550-Amphidinium_carterae.1
MEQDFQDRGRRMLVADEAKSNQRAALPGALFEAAGGQSSMDKDVLRGMMSTGAEGWFSPGPTAHLNLTCMWLSTVELRDRLEDLSNVWLSLLATSGTMLKQKSTNRGGLVIHVSAFGVLVWNMTI